MNELAEEMRIQILMSKILTHSLLHARKTSESYNKEEYKALKVIEHTAGVRQRWDRCVHLQRNKRRKLRNPILLLI